MEKLDLDHIRKTYLVICPSCDAGLAMSCACPPDARNIIDQMVSHLEDLYNNYDMLLCSTMSEAVDNLERRTT